MRKSNRLVYLLLCASVALLNGCAVTSDRVQVDWITPEGYEVYEHGMDPTPFFPKRTQAEQTVFDSNFKTFDQWVNDAGADKATRDRAQLQLISLSDHMCERHLAGVHGNSSALNLGFDIATLAFAGAASIVKPKRPAQVYGGLAALSSGTRTALNADVFYNLLAPAVIAKIRALRADAYEKMKTARANSIELYGAADAINDALRYHHQCSLYIGIQALTEQAGLRTVADQTSTVDQMKKARSDRITLLAKQIKALTASGIDSAELKRLQQQLDDEQQALQRICLSKGEILNDAKSDCKAP